MLASKASPSAPSGSSKPPAPQPPSLHLHHPLTGGEKGDRGERGGGREVESRNTTRSPFSDHSNCSSLLFSPDPRRRKKGRAPRPPRSSIGSSTGSVESNSLGSPATYTCNNVEIGTSSNPLHHSFTCHRKRRSLKNKPAPTPPLPLSTSAKAFPLTRSMSEQRQLNVKNLLNADPSFRSVVDLDRETRKSKGCSVEEENDGHDREERHKRDRTKEGERGGMRVKTEERSRSSGKCSD